MANCSNQDVDMVNFLCETGKLKHLVRAGWVLPGRDLHNVETVSGHMYRMAVMAMLYTPDEGQTVDTNKLVRMALIHDMAECIVGDITPYDGISSEKKHELEFSAMQYLVSLLPAKNSEEFKYLFNEYEFQESIESKIVKEFDLFDVMLQAFQYEQREYQTSGRIIILEEFFVNARRIRSQQLVKMFAEINRQRAEFWTQIESKEVQN